MEAFAPLGSWFTALTCLEGAPALRSLTRVTTYMASRPLVKSRPGGLVQTNRANGLLKRVARLFDQSKPLLPLWAMMPRGSKAAGRVPLMQGGVPPQWPAQSACDDPGDPGPKRLPSATTLGQRLRGCCPVLVRQTPRRTQFHRYQGSAPVSSRRQGHSSAGSAPLSVDARRGLTSLARRNLTTLAR